MTIHSLPLPEGKAPVSGSPATSHTVLHLLDYADQRQPHPLFIIRHQDLHPLFSFLPCPSLKSNVLTILGEFKPLV
jgi:hypothetical protein